MAVDFIADGKGSGSVAKRLLANNMDISSLQTWIGKDGRSYANKFDPSIGKKRAMVINTPATLRYDEWKLFDKALIEAAKAPTQAFSQLEGIGKFTIPNGMGTTILQYQDMSDINPATISMDGRRKGEADRPVFDLKGLPLPIIHKDFFFTAREIWVSRNGGPPLDTIMLQLAREKINETVDDLTLGTLATYTYGGYSIYGFTNFPGRITKSMTLPTALGWTPDTFLNEILDMQALSRAQYHYGPWKMFISPNWEQYLEKDYSAAKGDRTLMERVMANKGIQSITTMERLTGYQVILLKPTPTVARAVVGMELVPVEWQEEGGMELNWKLMCIKVPQIREDQNGNTGLVHGLAA